MTRCAILFARGRPLIEIIALHHFRWFRCILHVLICRFSFRSLFAPTRQCWKKQRCGPSTTWAYEDVSLWHWLVVPGWDPDDNCRWSETSRDLVQKWSSWLECCVTCLWNSYLANMKIRSLACFLPTSFCKCFKMSRQRRACLPANVLGVCSRRELYTWQNIYAIHSPWNETRITGRYYP